MRTPATVSLIAIALTSSAALASVTQGPFLDANYQYPAMENIRLYFGHNTVFFNPQINRIVRDFHTDFVITLPFGIPRAHDVIGLAYNTFPDSTLTGDCEITTIYGLNPSPAVPSSLAISGFDPMETNFSLTMSQETFYGASGTEYHAHTTLSLTLGEIATLLPGLDLSTFQGDPLGTFWVFQTTMPVSDMPLAPAPSAAALLGLGGLMATRRQRV